jgi:hypothetical protein
MRTAGWSKQREATSLVQAARGEQKRRRVQLEHIVTVGQREALDLIE